MKKNLRRPLAAGALAIALLFASAAAMAEDPPTCDPSLWGWIVSWVDAALGPVSPINLGDECGDGFW